ncbi:Multidrug resistance protein MdtA [Methylobacterium tardum]|uniref:RND transporter MFP subunit n=1 Tax=Methylobacterium tardum TaxID=374432 RepID=A0AA37TFC3_9HYPH|nr:efflux RND transporter periplasmic adaptor subunit [Methylobacterium tardum]URD37218.1 efflux RND transporter periplasmic adaptor subunit [Methylobacterium tardum]GJE51969.1 Multidrug resistance protein MdtA [Methylobacterium tardum]GLS70905.1 RND transporter MFP subunit [Methylobacterium tardum]
MDPVETPTPSKRKVVVLLLGVAAGAAALAYSGIADRAKGMQEVEAWTERQAVPTVRVVQAQRGPRDQELSLPGTLNAYYTGSLYARASGYVTAWHKDIGARVRKDEVLADISAPDLDQQLAEARATLVQLQAAVQQAQANADLSDATNKRTARLVTQGWSSEERGDTDRFTAASRAAALSVAKANLVVQQAVVSRLEELTRFKQIKAPFDGVVTARAVDIGDLLTAGGTSGRPLFRVSDIHRMRVYVNVPQGFLAVMKPGLKASLHVPGQDAAFSAEVTSTANAVAEDSRKGLVELQADNPDGALWPGAFVEVQFHVLSNPDTLRIPTTALLFTKNGTQVAEVQDDHRVALRTVKLGRNLGNDVEIQSGVTLAQRLIDNPQEFLSSGDVVQIAGESALPRTASAE